MTGIPYVVPPAYSRRARGRGSYGRTAVRPLTGVDLGRFRLGDVVSTAYIPGSPTATVTAIITGPGGFSRTELVPTQDGVTFNWTEFLGSPYVEGTYAVSLNGTMYSFMVVPGGDMEGAIISLYFQHSVNGLSTLAQTRAGDLILGRNPKLSE